MKGQIKFTLIATLLIALLSISIGYVFGQASPGQEQLHSKVVDISSAQILTSNTTPVVLVKVPNADYYVHVVQVVYHLDYKGVAYATNTSGLTGYGTGVASLTGTATLSATADNIYTAVGGSNTIANVKGKDLVFYTQTGNPTAGTGTLRAFVLYRLINISAGTY